jgi:hypothetical protein
MLQLRFVLACILFHIVVIAIGARAVRRLTAALRSSYRIGFWTALVRQIALAGPLVLAAAGAASLLVPGGFTVLRLLAQALFGETLSLSGLLGWLLFRSRRHMEALAFTALSLALLGVYWEAYHRQPLDLQVRVHTLDLSQGGVRRGTLRLLHISDIQTDRITAYEERVFAAALDLEPDLVVLTGDYVQPRLEPNRGLLAAEFNSLLRRVRLNPRLGSYAVRGDVDDDWPQILDQTGVFALSGESVRIPLSGGRHLTLIGMTPGMSRGHEDGALNDLLVKAPADDLRIAVGHNPNYVTSLRANGSLDLALAGHTHGGQVVLPFIGAPYTRSRLPSRFASGLHVHRGTPVHVSAGVGMERGTAPQIRFGCPPEICVLTIEY